MDRKEKLLYDIKTHNKKLSQAYNENDNIMIKKYETKLKTLLNTYNNLYRK